jgi:nitrite transporter NirC
MYSATIEGFVSLAEKKIAFLRRSPAGFFVASMLAGAYVGLGIILIFTIGTDIPAEFRKLVMGATFGIALTLVVIAGAELFTGHTMFMALRRYRGLGSVGDIGASWLMTWFGNLAGALLLVALFAMAGSALLASPDGLVMKAAASKMNASAAALFARAVLCNWLVCLAIWMSARVDSDIAKCAVIFWCLLAFIACGFEHSVANMTVLGLALAGNHPESVSIAGAVWNLGWVTLGNFVGGALFVGGAYFVASQSYFEPAAAPRELKAERVAIAGDGPR